MSRMPLPLIAAAVSFAALAALAQQPQPAQPQPAAAQAEKPAIGVAPPPPPGVDPSTPHWIDPETPEQRRERVGNVDPGPNPDEKTTFYRYGKPFHIVRYDLKWAAFDQPDRRGVRPFAFTPFVREIYQLNDKYVWVWVDDSPPDVEAMQKTPAVTNAKGEEEPTIGGYTMPQVKWLRYIQPEFSELNPPDASVTIKFEEASDGLPTSGSWRNAAAVADMNGDGFADIIAPPQRGGGNGLPIIFLGDGKGHWKAWNTFWPYRIDYGAVVAADFNKDGKMDLAFAVHLQGVRVFLGDGKGNFTDASKGLSTNDFPTRRIAVADMDGDGWPDLVAISEGPAGPKAEETPYGKVRVFLNRNKATQWEPHDGSDPKYVLGGDYLTVANFNGDRTPDFIGSSVYYQAYDLLYLSDKNKKLSWSPIATADEGKVVPFLSYYYAMTSGRFTSRRTDDAIMSYVRFWPDNVDAKIAAKPPITQLVGVDRISFNGNDATRTPIMRFKSDRPISGMGAGDFDHDGKLDVLFTRFQPERGAVLLLGDGKGNFKRAQIEGLKLEDEPNYDLTVADLNGDGLPDVLVMYEAKGESRLGAQNGSIHVFLNRGVAPAAAPSAK